MDPSSAEFNGVSSQKTDGTNETSSPSPVVEVSNHSPRTYQFWMVILSINIALFLSALELVFSAFILHETELCLTTLQTAVSTALPTIIHDLHGKDFIWVASAYALASTALLPTSGGMAEVRNSSMFSHLF